MKKLLTVLLATLVCIILQAQSDYAKYTEDDKFIFNSLIKKILSEKSPDNEYSKLIPQTGKYLLGLPYVAHTLECENEIMTVNFLELDCTTFVENVVVLATLAKTSQTDFEAYLQQLKNFRYRNGKVDGYASRIHYFSDWIVTNEARGFVKNVTKEIGGEPYVKTINYMTQNSEKYPRLADRQTFDKIKLSEENLNRHKHYYVPKTKVAEIEKNIQEGDLIAITCNTEGLDITHTGLAVRQNGRIHLMHASMSGKKVMISDEPLHDYLAKNSRNTGIMIARVIFDNK
ncbi:MAG: DUF1460 domain-containing protein [Prevotellaceae bacterium]|jgi:hypothetical protein|nr:DUF1460 domain-containing protein [Prevotellaceae bacterium]